MPTVADAITTHLQPLVGLSLTRTGRAVDMRWFCFGGDRSGDRDAGSEYVLHVQCAWRIEGPQGIVTGCHDLWEPAEDSADIDWDTWDYEDNDNLQDRLIQQWLGGHDPETQAAVNETGDLIVTAVQGDMYGGATLTLSGGFRLVLFPACSRGEDWRVFCSDVLVSHFVIAGGTIEA